MAGPSPSASNTPVAREVAHRLFAAEFNASRIEVKGTDERSPAYLVSPLGAKVNRLMVCGVLTEVENKAPDGGEMWRARISDPTGVFNVYAGQYQPEAAAVLSGLTPPQYVAVVGKSRIYEPEPGSIFVSVRPESVTIIDESIRNQWLLDTAKHTWNRVRAWRQAKDVRPATREGLQRAGIPDHLCDGLALSIERYEGDVDADFFERTVRDALAYLLEEGGAMAPPTSAPRPLVSAKPKVKGPGEEVERKVLGFIEAMAAQDEKGAQWDLIVTRGEKEQLTEDQIEEALNALMDKGLIYEPILGRLKTT